MALQQLMDHYAFTNDKEYLEWKEGVVTRYHISSPSGGVVKVMVNGKQDEIIAHLTCYFPISVPFGR